MQCRQRGCSIDAEVEPDPERDERRSFGETEQGGQTVGPTGHKKRRDQHHVFQHVCDLDSFRECK
jgi:hypothetical protein